MLFSSYLISSHANHSIFRTFEGNKICFVGVVYLRCCAYDVIAISTMSLSHTYPPSYLFFIVTITCSPSHQALLLLFKYSIVLFKYFKLCLHSYICKLGISRLSCFSIWKHRHYFLTKRFCVFMNFVHVHLNRNITVGMPQNTG